MEKQVELRQTDRFGKIQAEIKERAERYESIAAKQVGTDEVDVFFGPYSSDSVGEGVKQHFIVGFILNEHPDKIVSIEEPENHAHPSLQRQVLEFLREESKRRQVIITTHSPAIAGNTPFTDLRLVTWTPDKGTTVVQVDDATIGEMIHELGVRSRDFLNDEALVFVEGPSDESVFPLWQATLGIEGRLCFVGCGGWNNIEFHANARVATAARVKIPRFVIFDGDLDRKPGYAERKERAIQELKLPPEHVFTLHKGCLEAYLLVASAIVAAFELHPRETARVTRMIADRRQHQNKKSVLEEIIRTLGPGTKYDELKHAPAIARVMTREDIDEELSEILHRIIAKSREP